MNDNKGDAMTDTGLMKAEPDQEIAVVDGHELAVPEQKAIEVAFTPAQKELIKAINPDANPAELQLFMYQAARTGLDPIAKQIYLVRRDGKMAIQVGIDGLRLVAARSGRVAGSDEPVFENDDKGAPVKATVTVWMIAADGNRYPYTASARWSEYAPADLEHRSAFMWRKMPHTMLGKCAEALALRKACPAELSGIYTDDEMAQADFGALGQPKAEPLTDHECPACHSPVADNREAHNADTSKPAFKCSNRNCQGGGEKKKGGGHWPWATWDAGFYDAGGDGGDYGQVAEAIVVTVGVPANPGPAAVEKAWDRPASGRTNKADLHDQAWQATLAAIREAGGDASFAKAVFIDALAVAGVKRKIVTADQEFVVMAEVRGQADILRNSNPR